MIAGSGSGARLFLAAFEVVAQRLGKPFLTPALGFSLTRTRRRFR